MNEWVGKETKKVNYCKFCYFCFFLRFTPPPQQQQKPNHMSKETKYDVNVNNLLFENEPHAYAISYRIVYIVLYVMQLNAIFVFHFYFMLLFTVLCGDYTIVSESSLFAQTITIHLLHVKLFGWLYVVVYRTLLCDAVCCEFVFVLLILSLGQIKKYFTVLLCILFVCARCGSYTHKI